MISTQKTILDVLSRNRIFQIFFKRFLNRIYFIKSNEIGDWNAEECSLWPGIMLELSLLSWVHAPYYWRMNRCVSWVMDCSSVNLKHNADSNFIITDYLSSLYFSCMSLPPKNKTNNNKQNTTTTALVLDKLFSIQPKQAWLTLLEYLDS